MLMSRGVCYCKIVSLMRKVHKRKGFWLSQGAVQKYMRLKGYPLHSQTVQAIIQVYFDSLKGYFRVVKSNPDAKPPKRTPHYFKVRWIQNGISFKDGVVRLSNGKGNAPITLKSDALPVYVEKNCISNGVATISHWSTRSTRHPSVTPAKRLRLIWVRFTPSYHMTANKRSSTTVVKFVRFGNTSTSSKHISSPRWIGVSNEAIAGIG